MSILKHAQIEDGKGKDAPGDTSPGSGKVQFMMPNIDSFKDFDKYSR